MNRKDAKNRIEKLKKEINYHRYLYHVLDKVEISDAALDSLKHELYELEQQYPEFVTLDSPTQRVGGKALNKFKKVTHKTRMMSMEDVFEYSELVDWETRISRILGRKPAEYFCELKMDGLAVSLVYEKGILVQASTRGDGIVGEDVTNNIKTIEAIPLCLQTEKFETIKNKRFEVRGEIYISKKEFEILNNQRKKQGLASYANPRNIAAGSIRQLDPKITAQRKLDFDIYEIDTDVAVKNHSENFEVAKQLGFKINKYAKIIKNLKDIEKFHKEWIKKRDKLPYQVDGIVVKINNLQDRIKLGSVGKAYRWEIAYKWHAKQATTVVKDIIVQVGRTGALTPVAILEPVNVAGSTVSRATLHNEDEVHKKDIRIGDTVIIQKAGDVIPEVVEPLKRLRPQNARIFKMPKVCPICASPVIRKKGEAIARCSNLNCFSVMRRQLIHFAHKGAFEMEGVGPKIVDQLINNKLVESPVDFFKLKISDLTPLERFAEKSAENIYNSIQKSKEISLDKFIYALGIRMVGVEMSQDLAKQFGEIKKFESASFDEINRMYGVAEKTTNFIHDWLAEKKNQKMIDDLIQVGVKIKPYHSPIKINKLKDKSFVVTGTLPTLTREDVHKKIIQYGGDVNTSVTSKTNYLIVGENAGSKLEKAKKFDVKIISEKEFLKMIK